MCLGKVENFKILDGVRNSQGASFNSIRLELIIQVVMGCKDQRTCQVARKERNCLFLSHS